MGMTNEQWKSYLRRFLRELERLQKELPNNEDLQNMIDDIKKDLES
jgi:Tfp pilus assembly protein PilO